ncbi:hypothetical protein Cob_v009290 [Colletotrichum orbiculare MAFF 240422]|uniref:Uncharacterized protein n=1 Tax=Colletotrichum orbiculare (strain 104-T / ATCC 96160 / CBS 514.97 / LARS 414 / MAFF 240422) TaxID=1213857 RepID=A0A484FJ00_COLOR|nr:hypothetical protein Cob_v009290 [Colletotrichum orbiculare MAFF 240422]
MTPPKLRKVVDDLTNRYIPLSMAFAFAVVLVVVLVFSVHNHEAIPEALAIISSCLIGAMFLLWILGLLFQYLAVKVESEDMLLTLQQDVEEIKRDLESKRPPPPPKEHPLSLEGLPADRQQREVERRQYRASQQMEKEEYLSSQREALQRSTPNVPFSQGGGPHPHRVRTEPPYPDTARTGNLPRRNEPAHWPQHHQPRSRQPSGQNERPHISPSMSGALQPAAPFQEHPRGPRSPRRYKAWKMPPEHPMAQRDGQAPAGSPAVHHQQNQERNGSFPHANHEAAPSRRPSKGKKPENAHAPYAQPILHDQTGEMGLNSRQEESFFPPPLNIKKKPAKNTKNLPHHKYDGSDYPADVRYGPDFENGDRLAADLSNENPSIRPVGGDIADGWTPPKKSYHFS